MSLLLTFPFTLAASNIAFDAFAQADVVGKAIVIIHALMSVALWTVMLGKHYELKSMKTFNKKFLDFYRSTNHPAEAQLGDRRLAVRSPMMLIYIKATEELLGSLRREDVTDKEILEWKEGETGYRLRDSELSAIRGKAERLLAEQQLHIEARFSQIATSATAAPLIGLFGTVWGIMRVFMEMFGSGSGSFTLAAVAPGISGALLTTVTGLLVAMPATIGYNILTDRARSMTVALENFVDEYMADVIRIHGAYSDH